LRERKLVDGDFQRSHERAVPGPGIGRRRQGEIFVMFKGRSR